MPISEFDIIARYFATSQARRRDVVLGIGDDAAVLQTHPGQDLVLAVDTLVSGVHFPPDALPEDIGYKALAVNLSDLAAMGAEPAWFTLALTVPGVDEDWLGRFADGLFSLADVHDMALVGGDTTRGPLTVSVQVAGFVPSGMASGRAGARPGDLICVTGTLGDAALGLRVAQGTLACGYDDDRFLLGRLNRPTPRIDVGYALRSRVHASIDISDGLAADLEHVLDASGVGATIEVARLPLSSAYRGFLEKTTEHSEALWPALSGGDDYELCVCLAPDDADALAAFELPLTRIGVIDSRPGLRCLDAEGHQLALPTAGYRHFAS